MRSLLGVLVAAAGGVIAWFVWSRLPVALIGDDWSLVHVAAAGAVLVLAVGVGAAIARRPVPGVVAALAGLATFSVAWVLGFGDDETGLYVVGLVLFLGVAGWAVVLVGYLVGRRGAA